jgi:hypothetical protein
MCLSDYYFGESLKDGLCDAEYRVRRIQVFIFQPKPHFHASPPSAFYHAHVLHCSGSLVFKHPLSQIISEWLQCFCFAKRARDATHRGAISSFRFGGRRGDGQTWVRAGTILE